jgi:hypothetical protein
MTVEALRRRRPEALADLRATYGKEIQGVKNWSVGWAPEADAETFRALTPDSYKAHFQRQRRLGRDGHCRTRRLYSRLRLWGYSSAGRASEWHSEGQGFESP